MGLSYLDNVKKKKFNSAYGLGFWTYAQIVICSTTKKEVVYFSETLLPS
jgi:hypothetical protein